MVTCYDYWSAELLEKTDIDMLLVGDSLAMVMHGFPSTVHATIELMEMHSAASELHLMLMIIYKLMGKIWGHWLSSSMAIVIMSTT